VTTDQVAEDDLEGGDDEGQADHERGDCEVSGEALLQHGPWAAAEVSVRQRGRRTDSDLIHVLRLADGEPGASRGRRRLLEGDERGDCGVLQRQREDNAEESAP